MANFHKSAYNIAGTLPRISISAILNSDAARDTLAVFIGSRLPIFLLASVFIGFVPVSADRLPPFLHAFALWDGGWYTSIAEEGYKWSGSFAKQSNLAFFPLYPFLGKFLGTILGGNTRLGLLLASNLSLAVYLYLLHRLVSLDLDKAAALRTIMYVSIFPMSLFFSASYAEATLLALVTGAFYFARTGRWKTAIVIACLASLTRMAGVIVMLPLLYEYVRQKGLRPSVLSLSLAPASAAAYGAYLWHLTGVPTALMHITDSWDRAPTPLWDTARLALQGMYGAAKPYDHSIVVMDAAIFFAFLVLTALVVWRLPRPYGVYAVPAFLFATSTNVAGYPLASISRYLMAVFPCFIVLSIAGKSRLVHQALVTTFGVFLGIVTIYYFGSFWVE